MLFRSYANFQASPDSQTAVRHAHTLKGLAGTIGAFAVQKAAAELEQACHRQATPEEQQVLLDAVMVALDPVLTALAVVEDPPKTPAPMDSSPCITASVAEPVAEISDEISALKNLKERLKQCLEDGDIEAIELLKRFTQQWLKVETPPSEEFVMFKTYVERYDFDAALLCLERFSEVFNARNPSPV